MSLINEALKKAQRQRAEDVSVPSAEGPAGTAHATRRGKATSPNTMVLVGSGALVLVVLSVVFTVYLVNRPANPAKVAVSPPAPETKKSTSAPITSEPAAPPIVVPKITPVVTTPPASELPSSTSSPAVPVATSPSTLPSTASTPATVPPRVTPVSRPPATEPIASAQPAATTLSTPTPPATTTTPASTPAVQTASATAALAPDAPDERVTAFVEAVRVTGIRSSGAESRVLMNERVYRVNDIVERNLNIRLIKAAADSLTFADPRGVTYEKRF